MPIEIDAIIAQMEWSAARGLSEFSTRAAGTSIHIRRSAASGGDLVHQPATRSAPTAAPVTGPSSRSIDAPMAGICHLSGEPGRPAFVSVGDQVEEGQTVCIIEAMKVMTSVAATKSGKVSAILAENGASVDAGDALFEVDG